MAFSQGANWQLIPRRFLSVFIVGASVAFVLVFSQDSAVSINILVFYEDPQALVGFKAAIDFIKSAPDLGIAIGRIHEENANETDELREKLIDKLCKEVMYKIYGPDGVESEKPDIIIDLTRSPGPVTPSEATKTIARVMNLPTVSGAFGQEGDVRAWKDTVEKNGKNYLIQVAPPADMVPQAMRSIVSHQDMTAAGLLFDDDYEMFHKYKALIQNLPCRHLLTKLERGTPKLRRQIAKLINFDLTSFFIAAVPNEISSVLAEASDPEAVQGPHFSDEYAWYSMSMIPGYPKCSGCRMNVSVVHISPIFPDLTTTRTGTFVRERGLFKVPHLMDYFYFDLTLNTLLAVRDAKNNDAWTKPLPWNQENCKEKGVANEEFNLDLYSYFSSDNASYLNLLGKFEMDEKREAGASYANFFMEIRRMVFKPKMQDPESSEVIGKWQSGLVEKELVLEHEPHKDQWKAHNILTVFRVVTVVEHPFVYKIPGCQESKENKYSRCFVGYCIDLLDRMQRDLGFNYTIRNVSTYGYMSEEEPHEWDGMVRELKDRKADIALGAMSVMAERESVVDYTVPYYDLVGLTILMRKQKIHTHLFKFLTVLTHEVWAVILFTYFGTSFLMWLFDKLSPYSYYNNKEKYEDCEDKREFDFKECLWFSLTSLTPQGGGESPKNLSGRIVAGTWWLFGFVVIACYTANLAAFLTVNRMETPIESLDDLINQYKVQYAPIFKSSAWVYFHRMHEVEQNFVQMWKDMSMNDTMSEYDKAMIAVWDFPVTMKHTKIWQSIHDNHLPHSFDAAVQRVLGNDPEHKDEFAFIGDATDLKYQTIINCELRLIGEEFSRKPYAIGVQQGSPLKDLLNDAILKLLNERYLEDLKELWWTNNSLAQTCPPEEIQHDGISIHNIGGVFIIIFAGIVLACLTLVFEYWWNRKKATAEDVAELALPESEPDPKEVAKEKRLSTLKTDFNTEYNKRPKPNLPTIENSW